MTGKQSLPRVGEKDLEHRRKTDPWYVDIIKGPEVCTIYPIFRIYHYVYYCKEGKTILRKLIKVEENELLTECVLF